jgi:hypothetical protein
MKIYNNAFPVFLWHDVCIVKGGKKMVSTRDLSRKLKFRTRMFVSSGHVAVAESSQLNGCINNNHGWIETHGRVAG